jgi:hypothetical protein
MKPVLTTVSIAMATVVILGAGFAVAAMPSRPGMFLYPVRQLTRNVTDYFVETVVIGVPALVRGQPEPEPTATATSLPMTKEAPVAATGAVDATDSVLENPPPPTVAPTTGAPDPTLLVKPDVITAVVLATDQPSILENVLDVDGPAVSQQEPVVFVEQKIEKTSAGSDQNGGSGDGGRPHPDTRSDDDDRDHEDK